MDVSILGKEESQLLLATIYFLVASYCSNLAVIVNMHNYFALERNDAPMNEKQYSTLSHD